MTRERQEMSSGDVPSITDAGTRDADEALRDPQTLLWGLDSLYVSFFLETSTCAIDWDDLAYRKEQLRNRKSEFSEVRLGTEAFALHAAGKKPYTYVLSNRAFEVRLAELMQPSCHVQFLSEALWTIGLDALLTRVVAWSDSLKLTWLRPELVARADWAFDYHLPQIDFDTESFVSRSTKDATHREHGKAQTFRFGQGDIVVRVYDKSAEIEQQSGKVWFHELWGRKDEVWRVEFQVRGERLKRAGIRTFEDLRDCQNDLLRELAQHHTTLRQRSQDSNRSRWPLHPLWQQLQADIAALPQTGLVEAIDPANTLRWREHKQCQSVYGILKGLAALDALIHRRKEPLSLQKILERLPDHLVMEHSEQLWKADVTQRTTAHRLGKW